MTSVCLKDSKSLLQMPIITSQQDDAHLSLTVNMILDYET